MEVKPSLIGPELLNLVSAEAKTNANVPLSAFPFLVPGEVVYVTISVTRVAVEPVPEKLLDIQSGKLLLPGKGEVN